VTRYWATTISAGSPDPAACLAAYLAQQTGASVHAVACVSESDTRVLSTHGYRRIETLLASVTQQLHRVTRQPADWRLDLLVYHLPEQLARVCQEDHASLVILPEAMRDAELGPHLATRVGIPVACVYRDLVRHGSRVVLSAPSTSASQHEAVHQIAGLIGAVYLQHTTTARRVLAPMRSAIPA
jgi:hypothetical protein